MKKSVALFALLALVGCEDDDVTDLLQGKTSVFAVSQVTVKGSGIVADGDYKISALPLGLQSLIPDGFPDGTKDDLINAGVGIHETSCGQIVVTGELCFEKGNPNSCVPDEIKKMGLDVYKIDLDQITTAIDLDFYPQSAVQLGSLLVQIDFDDVDCSILK